MLVRVQQSRLSVIHFLSSSLHFFGLFCRLGVLHAPNWDFMEWDYERAHKVALAYANKNGGKEIAEDFAQEYCLQLLEGKTANIHWQYTNYFRKYYGDTRSKCNRTYFTSIKNENLIFYQDYDTPILQEELMQLAKKRLSATKLWVLSLYMRGYSQPEIAKTLGLNQSRICQILLEIPQILKNSLDKKETAFRLLLKQQHRGTNGSQIREGENY